MKYQSSVIEQALSLAEAGTPAIEICELIGVSDTAFYSWREKFSGLNAAGIDLYRRLEKENRDLTRTVDQLKLDKSLLQDVIDELLDRELRLKQVEYLMAKQPITKQRARNLLLLK